MHEQEVGRIGFCTNLLGYTCCHRNCGYTCGTDQRIDLATGKKKKGLGGGNCQVSTTLYNAILYAPSLVITERHSHSNKVPYIQNGKDAAVATGSYDLKFKNNSGKKIKIKASCSQNDVTIKLLQLS